MSMAEQLTDRGRVQKADVSPLEQFWSWHRLVPPELGVPPGGGRLSVRPGLLADPSPRSDAQRSTITQVDEGGCHLAVVQHPQGAVACPTTRCHRDAVRETAVCFHEGEQVFVAIWQLDAKHLAGLKSDPHTQDLPRTEPRVQRG
jgi:hypothetical protein